MNQLLDRDTLQADSIPLDKSEHFTHGFALCTVCSIRAPRSVFFAENLQSLANHFLDAVGSGQTRDMNRLKALYRSWAIPCEGQQVYDPRHRAEWLDKIREAGVRRRTEFFYQQLDAMQALRQEVRRDLLAESRKHDATKLLRQIPCVGPIRAAQLVALIQTPHRFRTKREIWTCLGSRRTTAGNTATSKDS